MISFVDTNIIQSTKQFLSWHKQKTLLQNSPRVVCKSATPSTPLNPYVLFSHGFWLSRENRAYVPKYLLQFLFTCVNITFIDNHYWYIIVQMLMPNSIYLNDINDIVNYQAFIFAYNYKVKYIYTHTCIYII